MTSKISINSILISNLFKYAYSKTFKWITIRWYSVWTRREFIATNIWTQNKLDHLTSSYPFLESLHKNIDRTYSSISRYKGSLHIWNFPKRSCDLLLLEYFYSFYIACMLYIHKFNKLLKYFEVALKFLHNIPEEERIQALAEDEISKVAT